MDSSSSSICGAICSIEKEHMFSKAVTPSDVGKLNRLVIPKQYAEKYFPLNSSSNENGLLLNFEDSEGKLWRFRYSYWKSSQSYVITKGWSRFVKEKQLDAGDAVSFERGVGELGKHRFFIDYRRRPSPWPDRMSPTGSLHHHQLQFQQSIRGNMLCYLASPIYSMPHLHPLNFNHFPHHNHQQSISYNSGCSMVSFGSGSVPSLRPMDLYHHMGGIQHGDTHSSMVMDSVPFRHEKSQAKRLRLFGVNMECPISDEIECNNLNTKAISHDDDDDDDDDDQYHKQNSVLASRFQGEFCSEGIPSLSLDLGL